MNPHANANIVHAEYTSFVSLNEFGKNALIRTRAEINAIKEAK